MDRYTVWAKKIITSQGWLLAAGGIFAPGDSPEARLASGAAGDVYKRQRYSRLAPSFAMENINPFWIVCQGQIVYLYAIFLYICIKS